MISNIKNPTGSNIYKNTQLAGSMTLSGSHTQRVSSFYKYVILSGLEQVTKHTHFFASFPLSKRKEMLKNFEV